MMLPRGGSCGKIRYWAVGGRHGTIGPAKQAIASGGDEECLDIGCARRGAQTLVHVSLHAFPECWLIDTGDSGISDGV